MPEMAVAQGAAYYGLVRRGLATRIKGGTPARSTSASTRPARAGGCRPPRAATSPRGSRCASRRPGSRTARASQLARDFKLVTNRPVSFRLYSSSTRDDQPGALVPIGDGQAETIDDGSDLLELPPIVTVLRARGRGEVTVRLEVHITELGALEIYCVDREPPNETWKLAFDMRSGGTAPTVEDAAADAAPHPRPTTRRRGSRRRSGPATGWPTLTRDLETLLETRRDEWSMMTARALFDALRRGRGRAQEDRRSRAALAQPRRVPAAPRHRRAARHLARAHDVGRVQRGPRVPQERARQARVVDRVAPDRRRAREGPAGSDLRSARASCCCRTRKQAEEARRGEGRASRSSPRCGAWSRASSGSPVQHKIKLGDELHAPDGDAQGPRGRRPPVGAVARRRARAAVRPAQRRRAAEQGRGRGSAQLARAGTGPSPTRPRSRSPSSAAAPAIARAISTTRPAASSPRSCARCRAAIARRSWSSRSSRSRRARSGSRSATRCRRACGS